MNTNYVIGLDYGTDSVRAVVVDAADGRELGEAVHEYRRWKEGLYSNPDTDRYRQHPLDYLEGLEESIKGALSAAPAGTAENVRGLSIDTTGSTPVAVDRNGTPLSLKPGFEENPNAMFVLWKDHTAVAEADEINALARSGRFPDYTKYVGGIYSSEWFFSKILHVLREDKKVRDAAYSWVEHCDWLPGLLTGVTDPTSIKRSRTAAGHKAMWHEEFGGLPSQEFLGALDPLMEGIRDRLYTDTFTSDVPVGRLTVEWAGKLGLSTDVVVGVGSFDAHTGGVGGQIAPYTMLKVMGTSTCDMLIAPMAEVGNTLVKGICGQVDGSIVPGSLGLEAGQSAFGDVYAWFKRLLSWPLDNLLPEDLEPEIADKVRREMTKKLLPALDDAAEALPADENGVVALDWLNGRRTPDADQNLKGAVSGLTLGTDAPRLYKALAEATAFGSKAILERFEKEGIPVRGITALGGVARKSRFVMQLMADVLEREVKVAVSDQACALGTAMLASVAAGIHVDTETAQKAMGSGIDKTYTPDPKRSKVYTALYERYRKLGAFVEAETGRVS